MAPLHLPPGQQDPRPRAVRTALVSFLLTALLWALSTIDFNEFFFCGPVVPVERQSAVDVNGYRFDIDSLRWDGEELVVVYSVRDVAMSHSRWPVDRPLERAMLRIPRRGEQPSRRQLPAQLLSRLVF
jgi:hypothetical protein